MGSSGPTMPQVAPRHCKPKEAHLRGLDAAYLPPGRQHFFLVRLNNAETTASFYFSSQTEPWAQADPRNRDSLRRSAPPEGFCIKGEYYVSFRIKDLIWPSSIGADQGKRLLKKWKTLITFYGWDILIIQWGLLSGYRIFIENYLIFSACHSRWTKTRHM